MPVKRRTRKRRRRRRKKVIRYRKRRLPPLGFPIAMTARLRCAGAFNLDAGTSSLATYKIACNAVHQPDPVQQSKQPRHYGLYADIYNKYKVLGAKITLKCTGPTASNTNNQMYGIVMNDLGTLQSPNDSVTAFLEDPKVFGRSRVVDGQATARTRSLTEKWSIKRIAGTKNDSDDVLDGTTGNAQYSSAHPSRMEYFIIWAGRNGLDTIDPASVQFTYVVDYLVKFWDYNAKLQMG